MDYELNELIEIINNNQVNTNSFEYKSALIESAKNLLEADLYLNNQNKKWKWYKGLKRNSNVYGILAQNIELLNKRGISIEKACILLSSLINYHKDICHQMTYTKVPTRFLRYRTQLSRLDINYMLYVFNRLGLIRIKEVKTDLIFNLENIVLKDEFITMFRSKLLNHDLSVKQKYENNLYFESYSRQTLYRNMRELILGISLVYTEMFRTKQLKEKRMNDIEEYGERSDILYLVIPTPLIADMIHKSPRIVEKYINNILKGSNYLMKHDQAYVKDIFDNYYNENYKAHELKNYKECDLGDEHPIVNQYTYMIVNANFENIKTAKNIEKKKDSYKEMIINYLQKYDAEKINEIEDSEFIDKTSNNTNRSFICEEDGKMYVEDMKFYTYMHTENIQKAQHDKGTSKSKYRMIFIPKNLEQVATKSLIGFLKACTKRLYNEGDDCSENEFIHYTTCITKLVECIQQRIYDFKNKNLSGKLEQLKTILTRNNLSYNFQF